MSGKNNKKILQEFVNACEEDMITVLKKEQAYFNLEQDNKTLNTKLKQKTEFINLAIESKNDWAKMMCDNNGKFKMRDDECCEYEDKDIGCQWYKICRGENELLGAKKWHYN